MTDRYWRGQGACYISDRDPVTGQPTGGFRFLGNVPMLKVGLTTQEVKHQESYTGQQLTDLKIETSKEATINIQLESFDKDNLALALFGTSTLIAGATVSGETLIGYVGKTTPLANINLTTFTSLTNAGGTTTYVLGTDYTVNLATGSISIPRTGSTITDGSSLRANYVCGNSEKVSAFTKVNKEYWLRFEGLNTAESNNPVVLDMYRTRFMPTKELSLIMNDQNLSSLELDGEILYDAKQPDTTADGRFFRERQLAA